MQHCSIEANSSFHIFLVARQNDVNPLYRPLCGKKSILSANIGTLITLEGALKPANEIITDGKTISPTLFERYGRFSGRDELFAPGR